MANNGMSTILARIAQARGVSPEVQAAPPTRADELAEARARVAELEQASAFGQFAEENARSSELQAAFARREQEREEAVRLIGDFQRREAERAQTGKLVGEFQRREKERELERFIPQRSVQDLPRSER